jgi:hypothetical protein
MDALNVRRSRFPIIDPNLLRGKDRKKAADPSVAFSLMTIATGTIALPASKRACENALEKSGNSARNSIQLKRRWGYITAAPREQ